MLDHEVVSDDRCEGDGWSRDELTGCQNDGLSEYRSINQREVSVTSETQI